MLPNKAPALEWRHGNACSTWF